MNKFRVALAALAFIVMSTSMFAQTWNKRTKVTFSTPVEVPGAALPAGTYIFKLSDNAGDRHVVQITNERENRVYATVLAINDYRLNASSKTVMYFSERMAGAPPAIKSWFYPGDNYGQRFVYPKVKAQEIAAKVEEPVPSTEVVVVERTKYVEVPVYIQTPAKEEVAYASNTLASHDADDTAGQDGEPVREPTPAPAPSLPRTASPIYSMVVAGLGFLGLAFVTRRYAFNRR